MVLVSNKLAEFIWTSVFLLDPTFLEVVSMVMDSITPSVLNSCPTKLIIPLEKEGQKDTFVVYLNLTAEP